MQIFSPIRHAFRTLMRNPLYAIVAILTLALGIGASTVIFSAVNAILLRPLPYHQDSRMVYLWLRDSARSNESMPLSLPDLYDYRQQSQSFGAIEAYYDGNFNVSIGGQPEQIRGTRVTANLISMLGISPILGRSFLPDEEQPGHQRVVLLSHGLWSRQFNSNQDILNRTVTINGFAYTVVGVMPSSFYFPNRDSELWVPLVFASNVPRSTRLLRVIARLKPDVTLSQAQTDVASVATRLEQNYNENKGIGARVVSLPEQVLGDIRLPLQILLVAAGFLLLIVCANVMHLQLVRAAVREKEMAIRVALGASRGHLIRRLLGESLILALIGGALGLTLAFFGNRLLLVLSPDNVPRVQEIGIDHRVLFFALAVSLLTSLLFGLIPALRTSGSDLQTELKEGRQEVAWGLGRGRIFKLLVVSEVAVAVVLLTVAGLLVRSFQQLRSVDPGFDPENVLTMQISLPPSKYQEKERVVTFFQQLVEHVQGLPGVKSAGITQSLPLGSGEKYYMALDVEGRTDPTTRVGRPPLAYFQISPDYFRAIGTPLLHGRFFTEQDKVQKESPAAIINDKVSRFYFPNEDPIGKSIRAGSPDGWGPRLTVIGVVADVRFEDLDHPPPMQVYTLHSQGIQVGVLSSMVLVVRSTAAPAALVAPVREQVWALDRDQPVAKVETMERIVSDSLARRRFIMFLLGAFAIMALSLANVGMYGVISYSVIQRRREIGIRMALGAKPLNIVMMVLRQGMVLTLLGIAIGTIAAYGLTKLITSLLYEVKASDPITFVITPLILAGVALLAIAIPAHKATKVNPLLALRSE